MRIWHLARAVGSMFVAVVIPVAAQESCPPVVVGQPVPFCRVRDSTHRLVNFAPRYPPVLDHAGVEGTVRVSFVVDSSGRADRGRYRVISSSHRMLEDPVHDAVMGYRFAPSVYAGQPVSTEVQLVVDFRGHSWEDSVPGVPVASQEVMPWGYAVRFGWDPVSRTAPAPTLSPEDSAAALRAAILHALPAKGDHGRALCVSMEGRSIDSLTLAALRARRSTTVSQADCPPTYARMVALEGAKDPRPAGAVDPDFLRLGRLDVWTKDVATVAVAEGRGLCARTPVCDLVRVLEPQGWRVARCRFHARAQCS